MSEQPFLAEKTILNSLNTGVVIHGADSRVLYCNARAAELLGLTEDQIYGRDAFDPTWKFVKENGELLKVEDYPISIVLSTLQKLESMILGIVSPMHKDIIWVLVSATPAFDQQGKLSHVSVNFHDITQQKRLDHQLRQQTDRYKMLLQNSSDGICIIDSDGYVTEASDAWCAMLECDRQTAIGMHVSEWDVQFSKQELREFIAEVIERGERIEFESLHRNQSGRVYSVEISANPVLIGDKKIIFSSTRDISARKATENKLNEALFRLKESIKAGNIGIWDWNLVTNQVKFSKEYKEQLGYYGNEFPDKFSAFEQRLHPDDALTVLGKISHAAHSGSGNIESLFRLKHKDGSYRWILSHLSVLVDENKKPVRIFGSHLDITDRKLLEEELHHSQKMEAIGHLAGGIAHDFNNQLGSIMGFAEMLAMKATQPELKRYSDKIIKAAKHSANLTKQLLTFSRKQSVTLTDVNVHHLLEEVIELLQRSIDKRITIEGHLAAHQTFVAADESLLQNAFLNLGLNARDAMPEGGKLVFTTQVIEASENPLLTSHQKQGAFIEINITDTGIGISPQDIDKIFVPFFTTKAVGKGTGMGLASVYATIEQMCGHIDVSSTVGEGSCFTLYLPLTQYQTIESQKNYETTIAKPAQLKTILVVDDESLIRELCADFLEMLGYKGFFAADGEQALALYKTHTDEIDLVILDMIMPQMTGKQLYHQMKAINPNVKAVVSTGFAEEKEISEIKSAGVAAILKKPFKLDELRIIIENHT
ncbi:PAS domain S-box protein [Thalassotalea ganghwensis]